MKISSALTISICAALIASCSSSPDTPVAVETLSEGEQSEPVDIAFTGVTDVNFSKIIIAPGAVTGPHCHYGNVIGLIEEGELTHYAPTHSGGVYVYGPGESLVEGSGYVHEGVNEGSTDVVLYVTYMTPDGRPLAEKDLSNCDESEES